MYIIVLGGGIDLKGQIPDFVYKRLDAAIRLYNKLKCKIILSGKYSFLYKSQKPPLTEAEKMAEYLLKNDIPKKDILLEKRAKDTIGNAYYLKKYFFYPKHVQDATIITSAFHVKRARYIFHKIFGPNYRLQFIASKDNLPQQDLLKITARQNELIKETKQLFKHVKDGNHNFLKNKIYKIRYYRSKRPDWVRDFVTKGKG